jgi:hypothetical protein
MEFFYRRDFLTWAREELLEHFGVNSSALSASQAREELERRAYQVSWSVYDGYKVQKPIRPDT